MKERMRSSSLLLTTLTTLTTLTLAARSHPAEPSKPKVLLVVGESHPVRSRSKFTRFQVFNPRIVDVVGNTRRVFIIGVNRGRTAVRFHEEGRAVREITFVVVPKKPKRNK
jgi:Flp pilus assembly secretin CpaC